MHRSLFLAIPLLPVLLSCASCASKARTTSTVSARVETSTFPAAPGSVVATDETGRKVSSSIAADGKFSFVLNAGHRYQLSVVSGATATRLLYPRTNGALDAAFAVKGGAANVDLGAVRFVAAGSLVARSATCADGKLASGGLCADEAGERCDEGQQGGDGECENGKDPSGAACVDDDAPVQVADATQAFAVSTHAAPAAISGCEDDDGEEEDD